MEYSSALSQKYRPLLFGDVLDQEAVVRVLKNIIKNKKFAIPFMFTGTYGVGKTTLAKILARAILCSNLTSDYEPCNECPSCKSFLNNTNLSYLEIDAATHGGKDEIKKLREDAHFKTLGLSNKKVVVIDECHSISRDGNDALLKQLEDNTSNQIYIFCTTSPEKMYKTVRSRCLEFSLNKNTKESIVERLEDICKKEKISYEREALMLVAAISSPHVRDAIKNVDYLSNFGDITKDIAMEYLNISLENTFLDLLKNIKSDLPKCLSLLNTLSLKIDPPKIYEGIIANLIKIYELKYDISEFINLDQEKQGREILSLYGEDVLNILEEFLKRDRQVDNLILESDLIIIHKKMSTGFVDTRIIKKEIIYTEKIAQAASEDKIPEEKIAQAASEDKIPEEKIAQAASEDKIPEEINPEELNKTEKIIQRYRSYPTPLALMMERSKNSSSKKISNTVEYNEKEDLKDYKASISKEDLKNFLNLKKGLNEKMGDSSAK